MTDGRNHQALGPLLDRLRERLERGLLEERPAADLVATDWLLPNFGEKPMVGTVRVIEGIRPGVISFSLGHGHWAYGASDVTIDGVRVPGEPARGAGVHANAAMAVDAHLKNVCLMDLVGGSVSFYDSPVRLVREG